MKGNLLILSCVVIIISCNFINNGVYLDQMHTDRMEIIGAMDKFRNYGQHYCGDYPENLSSNSPNTITSWYFNDTIRMYYNQHTSPFWEFYDEIYFICFISKSNTSMPDNIRQQIWDMDLDLVSNMPNNNDIIAYVTWLLSFDNKNWGNVALFVSDTVLRNVSRIFPDSKIHEKNATQTAGQIYYDTFRIHFGKITKNDEYIQIIKTRFYTNKDNVRFKHTVHWNDWNNRDMSDAIHEFNETLFDL